MAIPKQQQPPPLEDEKDSFRRKLEDLEATTQTPTSPDYDSEEGTKVSSEAGHPALTETKSASDPGPPPDGGLKAWMQVLLMHLVFLNTWGVANGFGVFQEYYTQTLPESSSTISWIGDLQVFFLFSVGALSGRLTDAGYFKITFTVGVFLQLLGFFMLSLCKTYWQIILAQGVCVGLGNGLTFCPALAVLSQYFKTKRSIAVGFASAGGAIGGLIYPALLNTMIYDDKTGFPWAIRTMAFVMLATSVPCVLFLKPRLPVKDSGPWVDWSALKEKTFVFFTVSMFLNFWGLYFAFFYMGTFARDQIGLDKPLYLVMVLNGVGILGRGLPPIAADKWIGPMNMLVPVSLSASILVFCWPAVNSTAGLYAFAVVYGIIAATAQALFPGISTTMSADPRRIGTRMGMTLSFVSIANLTGSAICGAIINSQGGSYLGAQMFAGSVILVGAVFAVAARISRGGTSLWVKV